MKLCHRCKIEKPFSEFYPKKGGTYEYYCKPCKKVLKHASPLQTPEEMAPRFWPKVDKSGPGGCWLWLGGKNSCGYGMFYTGGKPYQRPAHIVARMIVGLPIGEGGCLHTGKLVVDHMCRTPACVNPDHTRLVTQTDNITVYARRKTTPRKYQER